MWCVVLWKSYAATTSTCGAAHCRHCAALDGTTPTGTLIPRAASVHSFILLLACPLHSATPTMSKNAINKPRIASGARLASSTPAMSRSLSSPPDSSTAAFLRVVPSSIKNKMKRASVFARQKHDKAVQQSAERKRRRKETAALGEDERAAKRERDAKRQRTIDNTREADDSIVEDNDIEVQMDESMDEFSQYFGGGAAPKIVLTSGYRPTKVHTDTTQHTTATDRAGSS